MISALSFSLLVWGSLGLVVLAFVYVLATLSEVSP